MKGPWQLLGIPRGTQATPQLLRKNHLKRHFPGSDAPSRRRPRTNARHYHHSFSCATPHASGINSPVRHVNCESELTKHDKNKTKTKNIKYTKQRGITLLEQVLITKPSPNGRRHGSQMLLVNHKQHLPSKPQRLPITTRGGIHVRDLSLLPYQATIQ